MRKLLLLLISTSLIMPLASSAQPGKKSLKQAPKRTASAGAGNSRESQLKFQLSNALRQAQSGQYEAAANSLFSLARRPELASERAQIKYILGTMLMELKLYQTAAFQFVDVIRMNHPKYSKQAIEKLSIVADSLGDDTILNYAISRVDVTDIPPNQKDMINFRLGEIKLRNREYAKAQDLFNRVGPGSSYYFQALFNKGLAEMEANQPAIAVGTYNKMLDARRKAPVTDPNRVEAQLALARALYQKQDWEAAIEAYSQVPRDTVMWHDAVFEQSWAMLRAARFRSALSNFQTLHSAYYEDFYMPESLLLRSIVYLYICKYDEMEKVLGLFEKTYGPVRTKIGDFLKSSGEPTMYYNEVEKAYSMKNSDKTAALRLPYIVLKNVLDQGDVKRSIHYLEKLAQEKARVESNYAFKASSLGQYSLKIIANRSKNTKLAIGEMVKAHLQNMRVELRDLYEQAGFIRYEMINGRKESIKKKIAGKDIGDGQIDEKIDRQFYIQNGYQYYPFQGEYWLDEVGNYHYLGKQSCE
ncbi:tetratricopeptide repeat protein [Bdellovibrio svalbardensis]|uniref:Tetratricopeptide repeat protein n=1 Tax=Bdellovibrio svalbardensis TaxID=2972972 RepID=A0ABT6DIU6_9BACT|nr:tetratricopeptide repeat protein [Bdellovibrio svalbardensis]MDG0816762.1 tetratricopeptide repeat protein [Bdellovibrio svalbardensis]